MLSMLKRSTNEPRHRTYASDGAGGLAEMKPSQMAESRPVTVTERQPVFTLEKPPAIRPDFPPLEDLSRFGEYEELAAVLGYAPHALYAMQAEHAAETTRREVVSFLLDNGLPYYANDAVKVYMDGLVGQLNSRRKLVDHDGYKRWEGPDEVSWHWSRIDATSGIQEWTLSGGKIETQKWSRAGYSHAIPIDMLRRAGQIKAQFKDAVFAVTDYQAVNPDPFISVTLPTFSEPVIFGVWDEPGFGAIGKDA